MCFLDFTGGTLRLGSIANLERYKEAKKKALGHVYSSLFLATSGKKMPKYSMTQLSNLFICRCPVPDLVLFLCLENCGVPHGYYNFYWAPFTLSVFGLFVQVVCIYVSLFLTSQWRVFFYISKADRFCVMLQQRKKVIRTRGNLFHGERKHLHITLGSGISFRLTHSNEYIMCWDEMQVIRHKFGLKNKYFCRKCG